MAIFGSVVLLLFICINCLVAVDYITPLIEPSSGCTDLNGFHRYYNTSRLACRPCTQNTTLQRVRADGYGCECQPGYIYKVNFGGDNILCEKCPANQVPSKDGWSCIGCGSGITDSACTACGTANTLAVQREIQGTRVNPQQCRACDTSTSISSDGTRCERCTSYLTLDPTLTSCVCPNSKTDKGGLCFTPVSPTVRSYSVQPLPASTASAYFEANLEAAYVMCNIPIRNATACQVLGNLCTLALYYYTSVDTPDSACNMFKVVSKGAQWTEYTPWLYYQDAGGISSDADRILEDRSLEHQYRFNPVDYLDFQLATYSLEGVFLGIKSAQGGLLQLCTDTTKRLNAAYVFGTYYTQTCSIPAIELFDKTKYPLVFYDVYIKFQLNGVDQLYAVPLKIKNYRDESGDEVNIGISARDWRLNRRLFMVDNIAANNGGTDGSGSFVRYVKSLEVIIRLAEDGDGQIFPPYINIEYDWVSKANADDGATINPTFNVVYWMTEIKFRRDFQIAVGTLSVLGVLFAGYRSWVWSKRAGKISIDFQTILNFLLYCSGSLANVFFVVTFGIAFYLLIFFKAQDVVYLFQIRDLVYNEWLALFGAAFALKSLQIVHMIIMQCTLDIFLIDWEKPRESKAGPVSIWRTYFVANEWNEIQTVRKINQIFQIFATVFFLEVVGFKNVATLDPDGSVLKDSSDYQAEQSKIFRYGIAAIVYILIAIVQWGFFTFIYERFIEDKVRQFVDLCSMSNISVFAMAHAQFGYYIHGQSVHGHADTGMKEMFNMMKREEEDLCSKRGLQNTEQQTFMMSLPRKLRLKYEQTMFNLATENAQGAGQGKEELLKKQVDSYNVLNKFLASFIDNSLKDLDYSIRDKNLLESVMDTEFLDATEKGLFYNDDGHSFDQCLFYGNESALIIFDTLLFCIIDLICQNYVLAGVITYIIIELIVLIRDSGGRKNLARKTLVDERFLI